MNEIYQWIAQLVGIILALLIFLGWTALPIILVVTGKTASPPKDSYVKARDSTNPQEAMELLTYIHDHTAGWRLVHIWFTVGSVGTILLPGVFWSYLGRGNPLAMIALIGAATGGILGLAAVWLDLFGTPILAAQAVKHPDTPKQHAAWLIWRYVESCREIGLKSLSLMLLGMWMVWLASGVWAGIEALRLIDQVLAWASLIAGLILLFLGITQPLKIDKPGFGQRGGLSIMVIGVGVWSIVVTAWFILAP